MALDIAKNNFDVVILANGDFPQAAQIKQLLQTAPCLIACDGATNALVEQGITPTWVVGDLDSIAPKLRQDPQWAERIQHVADQETNDLTKAAQWAVSLGKKRVCIVGATGKREDHTLANISLLSQYAAWFEQVILLTDYGYFQTIAQTQEIAAPIGQQVSLFSLTPGLAISTEGLKYPIHNRILQQWWEGTLNEIIHQPFRIELHGIGHVLLYLANA